MTKTYTAEESGVYVFDKTIDSIKKVKNPPTNGDDWIYVGDPSIVYMINGKFDKAIPIDVDPWYNSMYDLEMETGCKHEYKVYDSGWNRYEYCTKCESKK